MKWFSDCPCINSGVMSLAFWPGPPHSLVQKSRTEGTSTIAPTRELLAGSGCNVSETAAGCLKEGVCKKKKKKEEEENKNTRREICRILSWKVSRREEQPERGGAGQE